MSVHQAQSLAQQPLTAPLAPLLHHRPPPPPAALISTATTPATPTNATHVSLQAPRPDAERANNEYVETPFRSPVVPTHHHHHLPHGPAADKSGPPPVHRLERPSRLPLVAVSTHQLHQRVVAVTKQPVAFTKEHPAALGGNSMAARASDDACANSGNIICSECGRCRCESCRSPRPLPECWVCDNKCLCSADTIIDYASCLCCVKALYYHCSDTDAGATCADDPCSCGPHRRLARWGCLGALAAPLPCLLCYWPLRGCQRGVEAAYARHSRAGCRCSPHQATPEKRLLDSSPEF